MCADLSGLNRLCKYFIFQCGGKAIFIPRNSRNPTGICSVVNADALAVGSDEMLADPITDAERTER
jgi:hypothetical protein